MSSLHCQAISIVGKERRYLVLDVVPFEEDESRLVGLLQVEAAQSVAAAGCVSSAVGKFDFHGPG